MSDEIEFLEEDEENNTIKLGEDKAKEAGCAITVIMIAIQLSGVAGVAVLDFIWDFIDGDEAHVVLFSVVVSVVLLIINAWVNYSGGNGKAAILWSLGIYAILLLPFIHPVASIFGIVVTVGWIIYDVYSGNGMHPILLSVVLIGAFAFDGELSFIVRRIWTLFVFNFG